MVVALSEEATLLGKGRGAQTLRGHRRRNTVLKVAAQLFAEQGYDSVSINDIGSAAGITGPAIYRYFTSKEILLVSIYEELQGLYRDGLVAVTTATTVPADVVRGLVDLHLRLAIEHPEKIRIVTN